MTEVFSRLEHARKTKKEVRLQHDFIKLLACEVALLADFNGPVKTLVISYGDSSRVQGQRPGTTILPGMKSGQMTAKPLQVKPCVHSDKVTAERGYWQRETY